MVPESEGRAALLGALTSAVGRRLGPEGPPGAAILLTGAGGIGKTYALEHLQERFADGPGGPDVRLGAADATITGVPGAAAARLLPELRPGIDDPADVIGALARDRPLLLMLDNADLADGLTLAALHRIAHDPPPRTTLVVARRGLPVRGPLTMLAGAPGTTELQLSPLGRAEVHRLAEARLGGAPGPSLARALDVAGGNPGHVNRILDWVLYRRRAQPGRATDAVDVRLSTAQLVEICGRSVESQLRILDPDVLQVVRLVAVWGTPVTAAQLGLARRQHPSEIVGGIDAAVGAGLLVREGDRIRFGAEIAAEVVRGSLDAPLRQLLEAAVHAAGGGHPAHTSTASPILRMQSSLQIGGRLPAPPQLTLPPDATAELTSADLTDADSVAARATMLSDAGRLREAYELARDACAAQTDPERQVQLLFMMLAFCTVGARVDRARETLATMRTLPLPPESEAWLHEIEMWLGAMSGRPPDAARRARLAAADDEPPGLTGDRTARALGMVADGDCVGALTLLDTHLDAAARMGGTVSPQSPDAAAWPLWVARFAYGPASTLTRAPAGGAPDTNLVTRWLGPFRQGVIAEAHLAGGELDIAAMLLDDTLAEARRIGSGWVSGAVADRALIDVHRGAADAALDLLARWRTRGLPARFGLRDIDFAECEARLADGPSETLRAQSAELWAAARDEGHVPWLLYRAPALARQARMCGDDEQLARIAADCAVLWGAADAPALHGYATLVQAIAADHAPAAERAAARFQAVGDQLGELSAYEEAACAAARRGHLADAREYADLAARLAERIGSVATLRRLRERLRGHRIVLGSAAPRSTAAGWDALTPAESRVSLLVADGMTGPQIARRLGISPRTVQTHVSHALRKLGLSTRAELAVFVARSRA